MVDRKTASDPLRRRLRRLGRFERAEEARAFVRRFHRELGMDEQTGASRERTVVRELRRFGWYEHTPEELAYGARLAWRHSGRCIGRLHWKSLDVVDARSIHEPADVAAVMFSHLDTAYSEGKIQSLITIFEPVKKEKLPTHIESRQALQYAGWFRPGSPVLGDPLNVEITRTVESLGWRSTEGDPRFEVLPLLVRDGRQRRSIHPIPAASRNEIAIKHPDIDEIGDLGLRWYAVPCVSSMILTIGGVDYPCAPFNGHYMGTEIASRNFADERRYNLLSEVARRMDLDLTVEPPLWKDQALLALNEAVLWSFADAGVCMTDHHTESRRYMDFAELERADGREPAADWTWITPPQAGPACPVFHMKMRDHHPVPNFYHDRGNDGIFLRPDYADLERWRYAERWDRFRYRWRRWWRRRDGLRPRS